MNVRIFERKDSKAMRPSSLSFQKHFQSLAQIRKVKLDLMTSVKTLNREAQTSKASRWLFNLKIKHQMLLVTFILIIFVSSMLIVINQIHLYIFGTLLSKGFNQILHQETANFQASIMIKYMSSTRNYFFNDQQILIAINQIYNYGLNSNYTIDSGVECPVYDREKKYPSYQEFKMFCYIPQASKDLQTFENSTLNTEFVKLTSILNQFILCFNFQQSFQMNNVLQINLDNQEQMGSYYPQSLGFPGYLPSQRPFFIFQKDQYERNITSKFHISKYYRWFINFGTTKYGQTLTLSLLNGTIFQGVIALSIQFSVFDYILRNFPDVNIALVALDGTVLFEQTQLQIFNQQQFIYNQSSTGYNYLDWIKLSSHKDHTTQLVINNSLFPRPIKVNVKKFHDLPYYFIVYNNLTYECQVKNIQAQILDQIQSNYHSAITTFPLIFSTILIGCYFTIEFILQPLKIISNLIYHSEENFTHLKQLIHRKCSKNILDILSMIIYLKYSEFQNLSFKKSQQCKKIESIGYPNQYYTKSKICLLRYLQHIQLIISNNSLCNVLDYEASSHLSQLESESGYTFTFDRNRQIFALI